MSRLRAVTLSFLLLVSALAGVLAFGAGHVAATQTGGNTYVVGSCTTGDQTGFSTVSEAVGNAEPDATVLVCSGNYNEQVTVDKSLTIVTAADDVNLVGNSQSTYTTAFDVTSTAADDVTIGAGAQAGNEGFNITGYTSTGISADGVTGLTVNNSDIGEFDGGGGTGIDVSNSGDVAIRNNTVGNLTTGIALSGTSSSGTTEITDNVIGNVTNGIVLTDPADVTVKQNAIVNQERGIDVAVPGSVSGVTITENVIDGNDTLATDSTPSTGIRFSGSGYSGSAPGTEVNTYLNVLRNNSQGVYLDSNDGDFDPNGIRFAFNFFQDNATDSTTLTAVDNDLSSTFVARQNYFAADSGPSGGVNDPRTGAPADGDGQGIEVANAETVAFDPWLGKSNVCSGGQFTSAFDSLSSELDNYPTEIRGVSVEAALPVCAWDRAAFPLRGTTGSAETVVPLPLIEAGAGAPGSATNSINRDEIVVYTQDDGVTLEYSKVDGVADTTQFPDKPVQVLVLEDIQSTEQSDLLTGGSFSNETGTVTLETGATTARVLEPGSLGSGSITITDTPNTPGPVAYVVVQPEFGDGLTDAPGDGTVKVQGGIDVIGATVVPVQEAGGNADLQSGTVTAGNNVEFQPNSNLGSGTTTHLVGIYDRDVVQSGLVKVFADTTVDDVLALSTSTSDVTVQTSITAASGTFDFQDDIVVDTEVFGQTVDLTLSGISTGKQSLTGEDYVEGINPMTVVNASATSVESNGPQPGTINVATDENFATGTYQFVYLAQQGSGYGGFSTDAGTVTIEAPDTGGDDGDDGDDGDGGGGGGGAAPTQPTSSFVVVNTSVSPDRIAPGNTTTVTVTVRNNRTNAALLEQKIAVRVRGDRRATRTVSLAAAETRTVEIPLTLTEEGRFTVSVNGQSAGLVTVLPQNVDDRSSSRVFDQNSRVPGVQVRFPRTAVRQITFPAEADGKANVDQLNRLPRETPQPPGVLVQSLDITVPEPLRDQGATIEFEVERSQLTDLGVDAESVRMYRFNDGEWQPLDTTLVRESGGSLIYESGTPGFSLFAVTGQEATPTPVTPTPTPETSTATPTPETPTDTASPTGPTETSPPGDGGDNTAILLGALILLLLIAGAGAALYLAREDEDGNTGGS